MAIVTDAITKILSDYNNIDLQVNSALKYRFSYNGYVTDAFYTVEDGLAKQLLVLITINGVTYVTTLNFNQKENEYYMNFYLPNELYEKVKFSLLYVNNRCATKPYFEAMFNYILTHQPIAILHREELRNRQIYQYTLERDKPYFKTTRRDSMSERMRAKILDKYSPELAKKIFRFCGKTKTLVFTDKIEESKDIEIYMNNQSM